MTHKVLWTVGLANGETHYEEKGNFQTITGELSPWQRLLAYLRTADTHITSLALYTDDGRRWNLASAGKAPKFKAFGDAEKPESYRFYRKMGGDIIGDGAIQNQENYAVAEATYADGTKTELWVDNATGNAWTLLKR